jgi:hypothetical protein
MSTLQITKQELVEKLQTEIVQLRFTKADGTERFIVCTKKSSDIPEEFHPKTDKVVKLDENGQPVESDNITVWDIENQGWRSFNFTKIIEVK